MKFYRLLPLSLWLLAIGPLMMADADEKPDREGIQFFEAKIRPVLVRHCYECHSQVADEVQGNFRVDTREAFRQGGDNGTAIVPGKPDEGFLMPVLRYEEDDYQMPPSGKLPAEVIADFRRWIQMGAPDPRD